MYQNVFNQSSGENNFFHCGCKPSRFLWVIVVGNRTAEAAGDDSLLPGNRMAEAVGDWTAPSASHVSAYNAPTKPPQMQICPMLSLWPFFIRELKAGNYKQAEKCGKTHLSQDRIGGQHPSPRVRERHMEMENGPLRLEVLCVSEISTGFGAKRGDQD